MYAIHMADKQWLYINVFITWPFSQCVHKTPWAYFNRKENYWELLSTVKELKFIQYFITFTCIDKCLLRDAVNVSYSLL